MFVFILVSFIKFVEIYIFPPSVARNLRLLYYFKVKFFRDEIFERERERENVFLFTVEIYSCLTS